MSEEARVLEANAAFYRAFAGRDAAGMEALWARGCDVACLHPGSPPLHGREDVMRSWRTILSDARAPRIACAHPRAYLLGETAVVVCFETVEGGALVATNVFVREAGAWRMMHHQAGPTNARPSGSAEGPAGGPPAATVH